MKWKSPTNGTVQPASSSRLPDFEDRCCRLVAIDGDPDQLGPGTGQVRRTGRAWPRRRRCRYSSSSGRRPERHRRSVRPRPGLILVDVPVRTGRSPIQWRSYLCREAAVETFVCRVEEGPGLRYLEARVAVVGEDLVVAVGGGERPHVGCVVLAIPYPRKGARRVVGVVFGAHHPATQGRTDRARDRLPAGGRARARHRGDRRGSRRQHRCRGYRLYLRLGEELADELFVRSSPIECRQR